MLKIEKSDIFLSFEYATVAVKKKSMNYYTIYENEIFLI